MVKYLLEKTWVWTWFYVPLDVVRNVQTDVSWKKHEHWHYIWVLSLKKTVIQFVVWGILYKQTFNRAC